MTNKTPKFNIFVIDVDGVMTTGHFLYSTAGKSMKIFGPDDNDALKLLSKFIEIQFVTGDRSGYEISKKRIVHDMKFNLELVSTFQRLDWIKNRYDINQVVYMGDGIFDHLVLDAVGYGIAPANADETAKNHANYITKRNGGDRAVAEAAIHLLENFFKPIKEILSGEENIELSGGWSLSKK